MCKGLVKINLHLVGFEHTTSSPYEVWPHPHINRVGHIQGEAVYTIVQNPHSDYNSLLKFPLSTESSDQSELAKPMMGGPYILSLQKP